MLEMREKLKIFVSAYACEPNLGSEIGVGWNWVLQMSKYFELYVRCFFQMVGNGLGYDFVALT